MLTIFNRCELCITTNTEQQYRIRTILSDNNIEYYIKTTNLLSPSPFGRSYSRGGTIGLDLKQIYEYKFYVHKHDKDKATYLINKR